MLKNKLVVISILAAILVSGALSVAAAQELPQVPTPSGDVISYAPRPQPDIAPTIENAPTINITTPKMDVISYVPRPQGQPVPSVSSATTTGPDGVTTTIANVTLPAPIYQTEDGVPAFDVNGNGQEITSSNGSDEPIYIAQQQGMGDVTPIYLMGENTADTLGATAATAVGLVVAALSMGAVGIVCLSKHP